MGAVQHLLQVSRVEPHGPEHPPRQGGGHRRPVQRLLDGRLPGPERLQECMPQRLADEARQHTALEGREHPIDARYVRDESAHRREFRSVAFADRRRGRSPGVSGQLDRGRGPRRRLAEHIERPRLVHHARTAVGRQVGQAPPMPQLLGGHHVAAVRRPPSSRGRIRTATSGRAGRVGEGLQCFAVFVERRRIDQQHGAVVFPPHELHAHSVRLFPWVPSHPQRRTGTGPVRRRCAVPGAITKGVKRRRSAPCTPARRCRIVRGDLCGGGTATAP